MIPTTLVTGHSASKREAAIHAQLDPTLSTAVILEGLSDGREHFQPTEHPHLQLQRIAPGCMCCTGNLVMRVTLNRLLRSKPARLYISVATDTHLPQLREILAAAPYDSWLTLTEDLSLP